MFQQLDLPRRIFMRLARINLCIKETWLQSEVLKNPKIWWLKIGAKMFNKMLVQVDLRTILLRQTLAWWRLLKSSKTKIFKTKAQICKDKGRKMGQDVLKGNIRFQKMKISRSVKQLLSIQVKTFTNRVLICRQKSPNKIKFKILRKRTLNLWIQEMPPKLTENNKGS